MQARFDRLRSTRTFARGAHDRWCASRIGVFGAGNLGGRFAIEAVRSGASIAIWDFDIGEPTNLGTQDVEPGVAKVSSVVAACERVVRGRATGLVADARHAGVGELRAYDLLVDCTDDAELTAGLTEVSNGLGVPLLRLAIDGSGERELGRVRCSHGGAGYACQMCSWAVSDLRRSTVRTPCPGRATDLRAPTIAGGAIGMTIAGIGLLQAQRLLGGVDDDCVLDREIMLDLSSAELHALTLRRSSDCISGHRSWELHTIPADSARTTLLDVFEFVRPHFEGTSPTLEPFGHPLCLSASCECGESAERAGSRWAHQPPCARCGRAMTWTRDVDVARFERSVVEQLSLGASSLADLGLPTRGALFVARAPGRSTLRVVLEEDAR